MSNKYRYKYVQLFIDIKSRTNYFLNDIHNIKNFHPINIKIDKKSCKIFLFNTWDMW